MNKPCEWGFFLTGAAALVLSILKCVKYCDSRDFDRRMRELDSDYFDELIDEEDENE